MNILAYLGGTDVIFMNISRQINHNISHHFVQVVPAWFLAVDGHRKTKKNFLETVANHIISLDEKPFLRDNLDR